MPPLRGSIYKPNFRPVLFVVGMMLVALAISMLIPAWASFTDEPGLAFPFMISAGVSAFFGGSAVIVGWRRDHSITVREAFLITTVSWVAVSAVATLPLILSEHMSFTDAFFECMSGLTTTGSTVMTGLDDLPVGILLWRSLLQWIGGFGVVNMAILIMPFLRIGGMQLFRTESSDRSEKVVARPLQLSAHLGLIYFALTALCGTAYWLAGMPAFDAANHAMTTLATGGFSTHDASFGFYPQLSVQWIGVVFMLAGSIPFVLYIKTIAGDRWALLRDQQIRGFIGLLAALVVATLPAVWSDQVPFWRALTLAAFNLTSIITTTGFASVDYTLWGAFPIAVFFFVTFFGACTGSTAGGIKIFRLQIMMMAIREQMRRLVLPSSIYRRTYNGDPVTDEIMRSVIAFFFAYVAVWMALSLGVAALGLDLVTSATGVAQAMGNVGPGLGAIIGPAGNFSSLPDGAKWLLSLGMLLGRLELFTVLVLFTRTFWRA